MSALINLYCDTQWRYGSCTGQLLTEATSLAEARSVGKATGWRAHPEGRDYCPACSGSRTSRPENVVHLATPTPPTPEETP